jgi:hypothetical protein
VTFETGTGLCPEVKNKENEKSGLRENGNN